MKFRGDDLVKSGAGLIRLLGYLFLFNLATSASFFVGSLFAGSTGFIIGAIGTGLFGYVVYPILRENWQDFTSGLSSFVEGIQDPFNPNRGQKRFLRQEKRNTPQKNPNENGYSRESGKTAEQTRRKENSFGKKLSEWQSTIDKIFERNPSEKDPTKVIDRREYLMHEPKCNKTLWTRLFGVRER